MDRASLIKSCGYGISTVSVILLAILSFKSVQGHPLLMACLIAGMASSIAGMGLRWYSYRIDKD